MPRYEVLSCDVWGNALEGYDLNDLHKVGTIEVPEDPTEADIFHALRLDFLSPRVRRSSITIEDPSCDGHLYEVNDARTPRLYKRSPERVAEGWGRPLYQLRLIEEEAAPEQRCKGCGLVRGKGWEGGEPDPAPDEPFYSGDACTSECETHIRNR